MVFNSQYKFKCQSILCVDIHHAKAALFGSSLPGLSLIWTEMYE